MDEDQSSRQKFWGPKNPPRRLLDLPLNLEQVLRAAAGDAPARWRMLAELVWYLEEKEKFAVAAPVDETKLDVFSNMVEALRSLVALVENAADLVPGMSHGAWDMEGDGETVTVSFDSPAGSWLAVHGDDASADLLVATRDFWSEQQLDEPIIGAGVSLHGRRLFPELAANRDWVDAVSGAGFSCELWDGWARVYQTRRARDLISFGQSLDAQAEGVAQWASQAVRNALALDPSKFGNEEDADAAGAVVESLSASDMEDEPPAHRSSR